MKIIIAGGSGQVGTILARDFTSHGHEVVVLSRRATRAPWQVAKWDAKTLGKWTDLLEGADVVINLAGRSVNCRYTPKNRRAILESRVDSTRVIGAAISRAVRPPAVWLQAGTATVYAHRYDAPNDEFTGIIADDTHPEPETWQFSNNVGKAWEQALNDAPTPRTRKVNLRMAMVMSPDAGGVFDVLSGLARRGLGGRAGDGRQFVSWIHERDFIRALKHLIHRDELSGSVNICAPEPLPNAEFMRALRAAWGIRFGPPAFRWMLEIGAVFLRTETELILKSRRVIPGRLIRDGFTFDFPNWPEAARDLRRRWRPAGSPAGVA